MTDKAPPTPSPEDDNTAYSQTGPGARFYENVYPQVDECKLNFFL
jgi:hypothetical protein